MRLRDFLLLIILTAAGSGCLLHESVCASNLTLETRVDRTTVSLEEVVELTLTVTSYQGVTLPDVELREVDGFDYVRSYKSHNISFVNGAVSRSNVIRYYLRPLRAGRLTIPAFELESGKEVARSQPIEITVISSKSGQSPPSSQSPKAKEDERKETRSTRSRTSSGSGPPELMLKASVDKREVVVGEAVILTVSFYSRIRLFGDKDYHRPSTTGFVAVDLPVGDAYYSDVEGHEYIVQDIRMALFPTSAGEHAIGPAVLVCRTDIFDQFFQRGPGSLFRHDPFASLGGGETRQLETEPITISVKPIPQEGRPTDFDGAVGSFKLTSAVDSITVRVGDALTWTVTVRGSGNIRSVSELDFPELAGFRRYDSSAREEVLTSQNSIGGEKAFEYVLIPTTTGKTRIDPVSLSFYDPDKERFRTVSTAPIEITVIPGEGTSLTYGGPIGIGREEVRAVSQDIRHIKGTPSRLSLKGDGVYRHPLFLILHLFPLLALIGSVALRRHQDRLRTDISYARSRRACRECRKGLKAARSSMHAGDAEDFYRSLRQALARYVADRTNTSPAAVTPETAAQLMLDRGIASQAAEEMAQCLADCDRAKYSPGAKQQADMEETYRRARRASDLAESSR